MSCHQRCFPLSKCIRTAKFVCVLFGWDSWIRTSGMTESKSVALPLGDIPIWEKASYYENNLPFRVGWLVGLEPTTSRATIWRSNQLSYSHHPMARLEGLEPPTLGLEGRCSIQLSYRRISHRLLDYYTTQAPEKSSLFFIFYPAHFKPLLLFPARHCRAAAKRLQSRFHAPQQPRAAAYPAAIRSARPCFSEPRPGRAPPSSEKR